MIEPRRLIGRALAQWLVAAVTLWITLLPAVRADEPTLNPVDDALRAGFAASLVGDGKKTTSHAVTIRGQRIEYTATVSGTVIQDGNQQPSAIFVSTAYVRNGVSNLGKRPVLFAWNGGPSGASYGVHFSVLGPRIRSVDTEGRALDPVKLVDNPQSMLDRADLVMVDPVGTGLSVPVGQHRLQDFYSINTDADSVARFIKVWLEENDRTGSPVYLLGESYGTIRLAVAANSLQAMGIPVAGQIYIGPALNGETIWETPAHLEPYFFYFPSYAVIANFHKRTPRPRTDVRALWKEAGEFALGEYMTALFAWPDVTSKQKVSVLDKLYRYTGISRETWEKNNLRLGTLDFSRELLKEQGLMTRFSDARLTAPVPPAAGSASSSPPPTHEPAGQSYIDTYLRTELAVAGAPPYREEAPGSDDWNWLDHGLRERAPKVPSYQNFLTDVALAMRNNPRMRVMQNSGMYDEQCNAFPADWALERMDIPAELRRNIHIFDYESGHAVFTNSPREFQNFTRNLAAFLDPAAAEEK